VLCKRQLADYQVCAHLVLVHLQGYLAHKKVPPPYDHRRALRSCSAIQIPSRTRGRLLRCSVLCKRQLADYQVCAHLQGYLAHKKPTPPLGPPCTSSASCHQSAGSFHIKRSSA